jgi:mercuric ion binding protein
MHSIRGLMAIALLTSAAFASAAETVVMDVKNMSCRFCALTITKALKKVPGVEETKVDFEQKTATVKYDPAQTTPALLAQVVTDAGFPSSVRK